MISFGKRRTFLIIAVFISMCAVAVSTVSSLPAGATHLKVRAAVFDVPVLNYHKIDTYHHALSIPPAEFEEQVKFLYDNGYHTITPDQLISYLNQGTSLPEKPILITFDDGYLDNYQNAYPILRKYGFTATIFIVTSLVGNDSRFMTWEQVQEMQAAGFTFGSHTVNHVPLTQLPAEKIETELAKSSEEIKNRTGQVPKFFAYPTGAYSLAIEEIVKNTGYTAAFTIRYGQVNGKSDQYALERIPIFKGQHTFRSFLVRLCGAPILERFGAIRN